MQRLRYQDIFQTLIIPTPRYCVSHTKKKITESILSWRQNNLTKINQFNNLIPINDNSNKLQKSQKKCAYKNKITENNQNH